MFGIREMRKKRGLTQKELSEISNVSRETINLLENGAQAVTTTDTLLKLAKALNCKVSKIFW